MMSFAIAREELSRLFGRRILRLALIVAMVVPLLYGALYLWAFWDPYGALGRIPVALVNLDSPARVGDKTITAGADLADELVETGTFGWHLVSAEAAHRGVEDGTYYSSLTIPAEFSASLATADTDHPKRARLAVSMHESKSMITGQIEGKVFGEVRKAASASASRGYFDGVLIGFADVRSGLVDAADGAGELATGLTDADEGAVALDDGAREASAGGTRLVSGLGDLAAGAKKLADGTGALSKGAGTLASGTSRLTAGAGSLASGVGQVSDGAGKLSSGIGALAKGAGALADSAGQLAAGAAKVDEGVASAEMRIDDASAGASQVRDGAAGVKALLAAYAAAHPETVSDTLFQQAVGAADAVASGSSALASGLDTARADAAALATGAHQVSVGASRLDLGASQLSAGVSGAASGAEALASGAADVSIGSLQLVSGASATGVGARKLAGGAAQLADGSGTLAEGVRKAQGGASRLAGGLARLQDGTSELAAGLGVASSGSRELADGLTAGIADVPAYSQTQREEHAAMMSDPVALDTTAIGKVANYGTGFAPYFIPLALWVGSLIVFLIVNPLPEKAVRSGAPAPIVALAGLWPGILLAVGQSVLMYVVLRAALGLSPVNPLGFFGIVMLIALVYAAIMQWLSVSFGPAGKLLAIVVLMLQLTSAAGTFPIETLPAFFRTISPWLPMTYAVAALREAVSGGDMAVLLRDAFMLLAFGLAAFAGMSLTAWRARGWDSERLKPMFEL